MPMYDLLCPKCRKRVKNYIHKIEDPHPDCPSCEEKRGKHVRMITDYSDMNYGIAKEGSGWTPGAGSDRRKV